MNSPRQPVTPAPSATVILVRETDDPAGLEVLLLQRNPKLDFHGGDWVFPGGRIDDSDQVSGNELASARRAAVRELQEEAGLTVAEDELLHYSHWITPQEMPKRFSASFFIAQFEADDRIEIDHDEIVDFTWLTPAAALAKHGEPGFMLPPPTWTTLGELAELNAWQAIVDFAASRELPRYEPRVVPTKGGIVCLYEGDAGFETKQLDCQGPRHRMWMVGKDWRHERVGC